jgi:hypothetical protein
VNGKLYFSVTIPRLGKPGETSVVLEDSITFGGENDSNSTILLKPLEYISYISKPYTFESWRNFKNMLKKQRETLDTLYQIVKAIWEKIHRCR